MSPECQSFPQAVVPSVHLLWTRVCEHLSKSDRTKLIAAVLCAHPSQTNHSSFLELHVKAQINFGVACWLLQSDPRVLSNILRLATLKKVDEAGDKSGIPVKSPLCSAGGPV